MSPTCGRNSFLPSRSFFRRPASASLPSVLALCVAPKCRRPAFLHRAASGCPHWLLPPLSRPLLCFASLNSTIYLLIHFFFPHLLPNCLHPLAAPNFENHCDRPPLLPLFLIRLSSPNFHTRRFVSCETSSAGSSSASLLCPPG